MFLFIRARQLCQWFPQRCSGLNAVLTLSRECFCHEYRVIMNTNRSDTLLYVCNSMNKWTPQILIIHSTTYILTAKCHPYLCSQARWKSRKPHSSFHPIIGKLDKIYERFLRHWMWDVWKMERRWADNGPQIIAWRICMFLSRREPQAHGIRVEEKEVWVWVAKITRQSTGEERNSQRENCVLQRALQSYIEYWLVCASKRIAWV